MTFDPITQRRRRTERALSTCTVAALLLLSACQPVTPGAQVVSSQSTTPVATSTAHEGHISLEIPTVRIEVGADGIVMPAEMPAGPVEMEIHLDDDAPGAPMIARFVNGMGMADLATALGAMETEGPAAIFDVVALYGGGEGPAMQGFTLDLEAGDHVAVVLGEGAPLLQDFKVLLNEIEPEPPIAAVEARMLDFSFALPQSIGAGEQVWHFVNDGGQWHETVVFETREGMSVDDLLAAVSAEEPSEDAPEMAFVWTPASEGEEGWATIDLPAGDYIVICFLPNLAGDMSPHFAHGMVRTLHVE